MAKFDRELVFALELALLGGAIATEHLGAPESRRKVDGTWVTEADLLIEDAIRAQIAGVFPEHNILGEERGLLAATGAPAPLDAPTWIIDPIDGTRNYVAGSPVWATLISFQADGENVVGVVHAPGLGETYSAARGDGARMNGQPISVATAERLDDAAVLFCKASEIDEERDPVLGALARRARHDPAVGDFRGHMLVARGSAHAMVEPCPLPTWDVAALQPIVTEAGGRLTALDGTPWAPGRPCLSSAEPLHSVLVESLNDQRGRPS